MCDYSLMAIPSRLAVSGDELVVRRFDTKSLGLAAAFDVRPAQVRRNSTNEGFWAGLRTLFHPSGVLDLSSAEERITAPIGRQGVTI